MTPDGHGFLFSFESIDRSFRYRVTAGSRRSNDYTVTALVGARVTRIDLRYEYPAFANLPPREEHDAGDIYAPAGTRVRVRVHTDKPIASGQMMFAQGPDGAKAAESGVLHPIGDRDLEGELLLARDDSYRVRLTDRDGLRSSGDTEYFLRVMDDRPPDVRILRPAADQQITPLEEVAIEARAEDDYGISRFELVYAVAGRQPKIVPFARTNGDALVRAGTQTLAAEDLGVQPGDVITYYARAQRRRPRKAPDRDEERHLLSRGPAVLRGVRAGPEPGHVRDGERADRDARGRAERDHQRDVEHRAARRVGRRQVGHRRDRDCRGAGRAQRRARNRLRHPRAAAAGPSVFPSSSGRRVSSRAAPPFDRPKAGRRPIPWARRSRR